jgi:Amt family ammonium transporter
VAAQVGSPQDVSFVLCVFLIFLVPFAAAGLALINTGLGRARSAAHSMLSSLCVIAVAALAYFVFGFGVQGFSGGPAHVINIHGVAWNWIAAQPFFFRGLTLDGSAPSLIALLQIMSVAVAALIPLGSGADRWRLGAICISTALFAGWTYPLFAHWVWAGGWLAQIGGQHGLGSGFIDVGGSSTIHVVGGFTALSITWILRARHGRYTSDGLPAAVPGHNAVYVLFGCLFALIGWLGLNGAGAILLAGVEPTRVVLIAVNTLLAAGAAALASLAVTRTRFGKPDASLAANSWIGGLVAISAACAFVRPAVAVIIGLIAGALVPLSVELFEVLLATDDPGGAVSTHAVGGIWGVLAAGLFASGQLVGKTASSGQFLAQLIGLATLIGFVLPLTYLLNLLVNRIYSQRVDSEGERYGMDLYELGAGAYPEFVMHTEDFRLR